MRRLLLSLLAAALGGTVVARADAPVNAGLNGNEADGKGGYVPRAGEIVTAGDAWLPYDHQLDIEAGSAFDFSFLADAPAGKYGRVVATPEGHLEAEGRPGVRLRFWGVNIGSEANFLSHADADRLADRLVRSGYNAVRIHHYDRPLSKPGAPAGTFDPEQLDRLDYWFAALKKRGIYVSTDLYCNNTFTKEQVPDLGRDIKMEIKLLIPISPAALQAWEGFARALLTHRNPYTGLTWGNDPALLTICPVNEDTPFGPPDRKDPEIVALYQDAFRKWKADQPGTVEGEGLFNRFLLETKARSEREMAGFLRSLGVRTLLTGVNYQDRQAQAYLREDYDVVDDHNYWNHPAYIGKKWNLPFRSNPESVLIGSVWHPRQLMPSRIFGKPFIVTESNFVWPNAHRGEGGILVPAYASLQDWDAVYTFDYSEQARSALSPAAPDQGGYVFSLATDPVNLLGDRLAALMFRGGSVTPAPHAVCYLTKREEALSGPDWDPPGFPVAFSWLGLETRVGSLTSEGTSLADITRTTGIVAFVASAPLPAVSMPGVPLVALGLHTDAELVRKGIVPAPGSADPHLSETGQIELSTRGYAKVATAMGEWFVLPPRQRLEGPRVSVENGEVPASLYVAAVDGKPLERSGRLLVLLLTDAVPSGTQFSDASHGVVEAFGAMPQLVRRGTASIAFRPAEAEKGGWTVFALSPTGRRLGTIPSAVADGALKFGADTRTEAGAALAYEIVRSP